ncbi:response regulator [Tabrizicola oligotrophica]|uniref:Response regulator n=1 Tax=Tabrizicola oligotrophica TaxID=2710650 RepID=A0A6M0QZ11_9RHOB|nr:response regulator [Tabrizicola oligotrophica]NEY92143.1 response regulator [Tabrizicola oligotrophica]
MKILAVDDDPVFLELLLRTLRSQGHADVTTAGSAREALALLANAQRPFDCLLLDIQMPEINGVQLCQAVRGLEVYRRTPIVMITAMSGKSFVDDAFTAGATDYITKPLDRLELKARMGMVARLHDERQRMAVLERQTAPNASLPEFRVDFAAPLLIPGVDRAFEYLALENYLLTLGIKRLYSVGAFAINIENADLIFSKTNAAAFVNMLGDVATAILDGLKTEQVMLSYAGGGNFVILVQRNFSIDVEELALMIDLVLGDFESIYTADRIPMPRIRIGELVRGSIFASTRPTRILDQAIETAQPKAAGKPGTRGLAA